MSPGASPQASPARGADAGAAVADTRQGQQYSPQQAPWGREAPWEGKEEPYPWGADADRTKAEQRKSQYGSELRLQMAEAEERKKRERGGRRGGSARPPNPPTDSAFPPRPPTSTSAPYPNSTFPPYPPSSPSLFSQHTAYPPTSQPPAAPPPPPNPYAYFPWPMPFAPPPTYTTPFPPSYPPYTSAMPMAGYPPAYPPYGFPPYSQPPPLLQQQPMPLPPIQQGFDGRDANSPGLWYGDGGGRRMVDSRYDPSLSPPPPSRPPAAAPAPFLGIGEHQEKRSRDAKSRYAEELEKKLQEMESYTPFGRGGAGAPLRARDGSVITNIAALKKQTDLADEMGVVLDKTGMLQMEAAGGGGGGGVAGSGVGAAMGGMGMGMGGAQYTAGPVDLGGMPGGMVAPADSYTALGPLGGFPPPPAAAKSHLRGSMPLDGMAPWQKEEAARKAKEKQEMQDALRAQIVAKEHAKALAESQVRAEEQKEADRLAREQRELQERHRIEKEEEARREEEKAAAKAGGKGGGDGGKKVPMNKKEAEEEARKRLEEAHLKAKEEAERLKKEKRLAKLRGGGSGDDPAPAMPPPAPRAPSPPIPTLRGKDSTATARSESPPVPAVRNQQNPPAEQPMRSQSPPLPPQRNRQTSRPSSRPSSVLRSSVADRVTGQNSDAPRYQAPPARTEQVQVTLLPPQREPERDGSAGMMARRGQDKGALLKQLESIREELQKVQDKVQKDISRDDARVRARNLELGDPYLAMADTAPVGGRSSVYSDASLQRPRQTVHFTGVPQLPTRTTPPWQSQMGSGGYQPRPMGQVGAMSSLPKLPPIGRHDRNFESLESDSTLMPIPEQMMPFPLTGAASFRQEYRPSSSKSSLAALEQRTQKRLELIAT
ncbi:hypothetical protein M427DRAFT_72552 [Gonapodya prolifera JEL478]|uniref:Uncharacterized protein n=1 Tax=Gonapodya prolifera (strain JEL478) TaxID=1344416 RepID=A0A139A4R0_GONPJ|nr:hypothetical protein M427DRAFT_72552 [Gonapodya prolifera JEL478]|eukprot:KXS11786.1 hypothetical protein M427DRAFT_72552 [Gonapodya prolifera JEL478]